MKIKFEFDLRMQELKAQYTEKSNEINRAKDEVIKKKQEALIAADQLFFEKKKVLTEQIDDINATKACLSADDPKREALRDKVREIEHQLSLTKTLYDLDKNKEITNAIAERMSLDDQHRELALWYERERERAMREFMDLVKEIDGEMC